MVENHHKRAIGVFSDEQAVEQVLNQLKSSGFAMAQVSIIAKHPDESVQTGGATVSDRVGEQSIKTTTGAVGETLTHASWATVLVGLSALALPGIGPILTAGSVGAALVAGVAGEGIGAVSTGRLVGALKDLGIPQDQAEAYSDRLIQGEYLVILEGTEAEIQKAEPILRDQAVQNWGVFAPATV